MRRDHSASVPSNASRSPAGCSGCASPALRADSRQECRATGDFQGGRQRRRVRIAPFSFTRGAGQIVQPHTRATNAVLDKARLHLRSTFGLDVTPIIEDVSTTRSVGASLGPCSATHVRLCHSAEMDGPSRNECAGDMPCTAPCLAMCVAASNLSSCHSTQIQVFAASMPATADAGRQTAVALILTLVRLGEDGITEERLWRLLARCVPGCHCAPLSVSSSLPQSWCAQSK
jgi:hypothetical protein